MNLVERIGCMRESNFRHKKQGWYFQDRNLTDLKVVEHCAAEIVELAAAVGIIGPDFIDAQAQRKFLIVEEIADTHNTLAHLMARLGITEEEMLKEAHRKLDIRFEP